MTARTRGYSARRAHETQTQTEFIRGDLLKGEGLEQAVESVSVVIHRASARKVIVRTG